MAHELQERYSALVDLKLRDVLVKKDGVIFNNRYEGDPKAGSVKVPVRDTEVVVGDYVKTTGATATHGDTAYITVTIDKDKAVNEIIDGYDAAAVPRIIWSLTDWIPQRIPSRSRSKRTPPPRWRAPLPPTATPRLSLKIPCTSRLLVCARRCPKQKSPTMAAAGCWCPPMCSASC